MGEQLDDVLDIDLRASEADLTGPSPEEVDEVFEEIVDRMEEAPYAADPPSPPKIAGQDDNRRKYPPD